MPDFDIGVIGAGPAGSTCAALLARQGLRVALFDRANFPRDKTCGDGITPRGARVLARLGALAAVRAQARAHRGVVFRWAQGEEFSLTFESEPGQPSELLVVPRRILDALILEHALAQGVEFIGGAKVNQVREFDGYCAIDFANGVSRTCKLAVLATGAETQVLRASGLLHGKPPAEHAARTYLENLPRQPDHVTLFFDGVDLPGYGWVFPTSDETANIGCGVFDPRGPSQARRLTQLLASHPLVRDLGPGVRQVGAIQSYPIRTDFRPGHAGTRRRAVIGEAAGLVNPVTGEGIDYAFESAEYLAQAVATHWTSEGPSAALIANYRSRLAGRFAMRFRVYRGMRRTCLNEAGASEFLRTVSHSPQLRKMVADGLFGRSRLSSFLRPGVVGPLAAFAFAGLRARPIFKT